MSSETDFEGDKSCNKILKEVNAHSNKKVDDALKFLAKELASDGLASTLIYNGSEENKKPDL